MSTRPTVSRLIFGGRTYPLIPEPDGYACAPTPMATERQALSGRVWRTVHATKRVWTITLPVPWTECDWILDLPDWGAFVFVDLDGRSWTVYCSSGMDVSGWGGLRTVTFTLKER